MSLIDEYENVLNGKRKLLPYGTWSEIDGKDNFKKLIRYVVLEKMNYTREDFCKLDLWRFLKKNKLYGGMTNLFKCKRHEAINYSFPEWNLKEWEYGSKIPRSYWNEKTILEATKWLIEDVLKWDKEKVINELNYEVLKKYNLTTVSSMTKGGVSGLLKKIFPDENLPQLNKNGDWRGRNNLK